MSWAAPASHQLNVAGHPYEVNHSVASFCWSRLLLPSLQTSTGSRTQDHHQWKDPTLSPSARSRDDDTTRRLGRSRGGSACRCDGSAKGVRVRGDDLRRVVYGVSPIVGISTKLETEGSGTRRIPGCHVRDNRLGHALKHATMFGIMFGHYSVGQD